MTTAKHLIVVEYTTIKVDHLTEYTIFSDVIELIVKQGAHYVEDVTASMVEDTARIILQKGERPVHEMLEELYIFSLCKLSFTPVELSFVSAKLCASRHMAYIRQLAENAKRYKLKLLEAQHTEVRA